jgi:D-allose transport system substrate-binding protein
MTPICNTCVKYSLKSGLLFILSGLCFFAAFTARADDEYVFILRAKGNPYWSAVAQGITETAHEKGIQAIVYQGQSETSAEEQLDLCSTAIQRKPKFLAITAATVSVGIECLRKAQAQGIKIAEMDSTIPAEEAEKQGVKLLFSVGSDSFIIGKKAAQYALSLIGNGESQILVLEGAVGSPAGTLRANGFKEELQATAPQAKIVSSISAEWDRMKAMNITTDILQRFPALKLVYAANDLMALGAVQALKTQGKLAQVQVIGVDGTQDARRAILAGEMTATIAQLPYLIGKRAVELGAEVAAGRPVPAREVTDTPILTKALLLSNTDPALKYVR